MLDFEIQRCARKCAKSDREFQAGETFYSVLISEGGRSFGAISARKLGTGLRKTRWAGGSANCRSPTPKKGIGRPMT